jgi:hypothetical protein
MSVIVKDGVGFSSNSGFGRMFMAGGVATFGDKDGAMFKAPPSIADTSSSDWSRWGEDNLMPNEMANHIENCGVLSAALDAKAKIAIGKGFEPFLRVDVDSDGKEVLEWVSDSEIHDWMEANNTFDFALDESFDFNGYGWNTSSFLLNGARNKINRIKRIDVATARLQKKNVGGWIENLFVCEDWEKVGSRFDITKMSKYPMLQHERELEDLMSRNAGWEFTFANRRLRNGRGYYPLPLWWAARAWVKVARSVPAFKNAMFANQITLKYIISISEKYWTSVYGDKWESYSIEEQKKMRDDKFEEIDQYLTGEEKAFKSISSGTYVDKATGNESPFIKIEVIDDKIKDGKLLPESSVANSEILFAEMLNPSIMGANQPGGQYGAEKGGTAARENYLITLMMLEAQRRMNGKVFNIVKKFNGWSKRLEVERTLFPVTTIGQTAQMSSGRKVTPKLVFRCPSGLLTSLDTGGSTKSETL